jgi:hypothetical protein
MSDILFVVLIFRLFADTINLLHYVSLNDMMINEYWIGEDERGSGHVPIEGLSGIYLEGLTKKYKSSFRTVILQAEI